MMFCIVLQCVAVHCSVLQRVAVRCSNILKAIRTVAFFQKIYVLQCVAVRCSALQCVAVHCSALQCVTLIFQAIKTVAFFHTQNVCSFFPDVHVYVCVCVCACVGARLECSSSEGQNVCVLSGCMLESLERGKDI